MAFDQPCGKDRLVAEAGADAVGEQRKVRAVLSPPGEIGLFGIEPHRCRHGKAHKLEAAARLHLAKPCQTLAKQPLHQRGIA